MNVFRWTTLAVSVALLTGIYSCDPEPTPPGPDSNVIEITADIENPTTWISGKIYVIKKWDFYVLNTLTIPENVIVKFHPTMGPNLTLGGTGTIIANGTAAKPVIFTSYKDDAHGGDTNGDGSATTPAVEDWGSISTNGLNGSVFNRCHFYYSGKSQYAALDLPVNSIATVTNCVFAFNSGFYGDMGALSAAAAGPGTVIQNNVFYNNAKPLSISTAFNLDNSNTFHNPADASQKNTYNGIFVESMNEIENPLSWTEDEVAFVIDDNDFWINAALTLGNNVVLKFRPSATIVLNSGANPIVNYNGTGVYFTSYKDDSKKGDTNADGSATTAADSDWNGIYNNVSSVYMTWSNILYDSY